MRIVALIVMVLAGGCLRETEFHCTSDSQCGSGGQCDSATTFCTVPDANCVLGRKFTEYSGSYTNKCVLPGMGVDAGMGCAPGFVSLPGVPTHLYHLFTTPSDFATQRMACSVQGGITYLAIPDDANELNAFITASGQSTLWVGIDDQLVEGTYVTVRGQPATFLPWAPGQPDNGPPDSDCVADTTTGLDDQVCTNKWPAICECEP